jgi:tRNA dimethylallyltransferase
MNLKKIIFIVGPTAVGKSDVAFFLSKKIQGEIISCDSMQIYKEINIASNKPSEDVTNNLPHHLINIISVEEEFDVARYNQLALAAIKEIHDRGHVPVVVGGSGMYMQVLLDGIFEGGVKNEALRKDLKEQARQYGNQFLYDRLKEENLQAAKKIHPNDVRRVIRALEISRQEKMPICELQQKREGLWGKYDIRLIALNRDR